VAYQPKPPFPKSRGDAIRPGDWNEAVSEVVRLEQAKLNQSGGTVGGNLAVSGNLSATGTISGTLAINSVGNAQLAANAVTANKIANGAITMDKLFGEVYQRNVTFTLSGGIGSSVFFQLSKDILPRTVNGIQPAPAVFPVFFLTSNSPGIFLSYNHYFQTVAEDEFATVFSASHYIKVSNESGNTAQIFLTCYVFRMT
jgi:hypothetical protein